MDMRSRQLPLTIASGPAEQRSVTGTGADSGNGFDEARYWHRLRSHGDRQARERLSGHFLPYARTIAATCYARRTHNEIEFEEYLQLASVGLVEALDRFDPGRGVLFKTFAARRMIGSILNGLERLTEKNQQIAVRQRLRQERLQTIKMQARGVVEGASANAAAVMGGNATGRRLTSQDDLFRYLAEVGIGLALGVLLDGTGMAQGNDGVSPEVEYFQQAELKQLQNQIRETVARLPEQEQKVVRHHYLQGNCLRRHRGDVGGNERSNIPNSSPSAKPVTRGAVRPVTL